MKLEAQEDSLQVLSLFSQVRTLVELVLQHGSHGGADDEERSNRSGESVALRVLEVQERGSKGTTDTSIGSHVLADPSGELANRSVGETDVREVLHC